MPILSGRHVSLTSSLTMGATAAFTSWPGTTGFRTGPCAIFYNLRSTAVSTGLTQASATLTIAHTDPANLACSQAAAALDLVASTSTSGVIQINNKAGSTPNYRVVITGSDSASATFSLDLIPVSLDEFDAR